jgi:polygalacturonase
MENGHGGVVIGSEMSCGVSDISVEKCVFRKTDRGFRVKTRRGRGEKAIVDGIKFENIQMDSVRHCFVINMFYHCDPDGKSDYVKSKDFRGKDKFTPTVKNISFTNIYAENITGTAVFIYGLPESKVSNITMADNYFAFADAAKRVFECPAMMCDFKNIENLGIFIENGEGISFTDNFIKGEHAAIGVESK